MVYCIQYASHAQVQVFDHILVVYHWIIAVIVSGWGLVGAVWGIKGEIQVEGIGPLGLAVDKFDGFIRKQGIEVTFVRYGFQAAKKVALHVAVVKVGVVVGMACVAPVKFMKAVV